MADSRDRTFGLTFDSNRLHSLLHRQRLAYTTCPDGTCFVEFTGTPHVPFVVNLAVTKGPCFSIRAFLACFYSAATVPALLAAINRWHSEARWPRAYVVFDDPQSADPSSVAVYADAHFPLAEGTSDDQLDDWLWTIVNAAEGLLTELYELTSPEEFALETPTAAELNDWLRRG